MQTGFHYVNPDMNKGACDTEKVAIVFMQAVRRAASARYCSSDADNLQKCKKLVIISVSLLFYFATSLIYGAGLLVGTACHSPAHRGLTTWLGAMASWEWNVECCVCRAPFPASLTAQAHANDQYY